MVEGLMVGDVREKRLVLERGPWNRAITSPKGLLSHQSSRPSNQLDR